MLLFRNTINTKTFTPLLINNLKSIGEMILMHIYLPYCLVANKWSTD